MFLIPYHKPSFFADGAIKISLLADQDKSIMNN